MKKTYSTPEIQLHGMNTSEAFMAMSGGDVVGTGGNVSDYSNEHGGATPNPDARQFADNVEKDWDE